MRSEPASPADDEESTDQPTRPTRLFGLNEVLRIIGAAVVAGTAVGYLLANWDHETIKILARIFASVAMVTVVLMIFEARRRCHIDEVTERLARIEERQNLDLDAEMRGYNRGYMDCLKERSDH